MQKLNFQTNYRAALIILLICLCNNSWARGIVCPKPELGGLYQGYGPYNYITQKDKLGIVDQVHFTEEVAALIRGNKSTLGGDIDYTLRAFPNHHRALESLGDLAIREKSTQLRDMHFTVPCYFIRAGLFVPTDGMVNSIYAKYLARIGENELAKSEAELAIKKSPNNPRTAYNLGLTYYFLGDLKKAKEYSEMAKKLGSSAVGLEKLLANPGHK